MDDFESDVKGKPESSVGGEVKDPPSAETSDTTRPRSCALSWIELIGVAIVAIVLLQLAIGWIQDLDLGGQETGTEQAQTDYPPVNADSWWFTKCSQINKAYRLADYEYLDRAAMTFAREAVSMSPSSRPAVIYRDSRQILINECRNARNPSFQPGGDVQARLYVKHVLGLEQ